MGNDIEQIPIEPKERSTITVALGMILGMLWIGFFLFFAIKGYGESGETGLAFAIFLTIMSFPSSLLLNLIPIFNPNVMSSISFIYLVAIFILGFLQWFILIPYLFGKVIAIFKKA